MSAARLIPWVLHELYEYVAGVFLILTPFLFFASELDTVALPVLVVAGVVVVALQLLSPGKASIAELLPVRAHATLDYLVAILLIVTPFVFGLNAQSQPDAALIVPILVGVVHLVVTLVTRFPLGAADETAADASKSAPKGGPGSGRGRTEPPK